MDTQTRWIELDGAVNVRDLGGLATPDGGTTRFGRVLRADNLQDLSPQDVRRLTGDLALRDVIDLRSGPEVALEGPGPLTRAAGVSIHHLSLFAEGGEYTDVEADVPPESTEGDGPEARGPRVDIDKVLPWQDRRDEAGQEADRSVGHYLGYLRERPDSVVNALRVMAASEGAALVHCAAGKDRTGVVCALALEAVGVLREEVVADYARTGERLESILRRLRASTTYAADLDSRPADSHLPHAYIMDKFLATLDENHGGALGWLTSHGWTGADTRALRARLIGS
ncbi:tyrosine-protein phosphatase [Actinomadura scrupuli]|uniref:tyrosine-protein phosphatase n=1 Tax=Actinomadura scrupuli TaxID=559629 RepID=UPI003D953C46